MKEHLKILILEDVEEDVELVRRELMKEKLSFTLYRVDKKDEYLSSLVEIKPNVILSDHSLPQFNSVEALGNLSTYWLKYSLYLSNRYGF